MPLTCNIDARGKRVRLVLGFLLMFAGISLIFFWAAVAGDTASWVISTACVGSGAFVTFEARTGWCAIRAMGFKTPL